MNKNKTSRSLIAWLEHPSSIKGISFLNIRGQWDFWSYDRLANLTRKIATGLKEAGVRENNTVNIIQNSTPEFIGSLYGCMLIGATPSPIAPPKSLQDPLRYKEYFTNILKVSSPKIIVTEKNLLTTLKKYLNSDNPSKIVSCDSLINNNSKEDITTVRNIGELALLQFTSGTSSPSRGVKVTFDTLEANISSIRNWLKWRNEDSVASWLPLHHDMGLVACLINPITYGSNIWLLNPHQFIRHPMHYLNCFGKFGVNFSAMPNFGLDLITKRVKPTTLHGMDFSQWNALVIGAEIIKPGSLHQFYSLLAPHGFKQTSLLPSYGLAEATLAVTGLPLNQGWTQRNLDPASFIDGQIVTETCNSSNNSTKVISCGKPLQGVSISINDEFGKSLSEGKFGEITIHGSSIAAGYKGNINGLTTSFNKSYLRTGDAGVIFNGELFVIGRFGDSIKVRGQTIFAEEIEIALDPLKIPKNRFAALLGWHNEEPTIIILFDRPNPKWIQDAHNIVNSRTGGATLLLLDTPPGTIRRTSSGKVMRKEMWLEYINGNSQAKPIAVSIVE